MQASIYWIRTKEHSDMYSEGYIGVTRNLNRRIKTHKHLAENNAHVNEKLKESLVLFKDSILIDVIFSGEEQECYDKEFELRPRKNIGWNIDIGGKGCNSGTSGMKMTESFCQKRSIYMIGNKCASGNHKSKSEEHKIKIGLGNKGKTISEQQKIRQSESMKNKPLLTCPFCGFIGRGSNMVRWHFKNCKLNVN